MKTLTKWMMAAFAAVAVVGCDPFTEAVGGAPAVIGAGFSQNGSAFEATLSGTAWTASGVTSICGNTSTAPTRAEAPGFIYVKFNKLLNGDAVQTNPTDCTPVAALNLAVTYNGSPTPPAGTAWFACYTPSAPAPTEGASIFVFLGACSVAGASCPTPTPPPSGWFYSVPIPTSGDAVTVIHVTGVGTDKSGATAAFDATANIDPDPGLPGAPTFTATSATSITVNWTKPPCTNTTTSYTVQRAPDVLTGTTHAAGTFVDLATGLAPTPTAYTDTTVVASNIYWYRVIAVTPNGNLTGPSSSTLLPTTPAAPTFTSIAATSLTVNWRDIAGTYTVQRAPDSAGAPGTWATLATLNSPTATYNDTGLTAGTRYWYRYQAASPFSTGTVNSAAASVTPMAPPAAPTFSPVAATSVTVNWTAVTGATGYNVQRAPDVAGAPGTFATRNTGAITTGTSYVDTTVTATVYWYRVVALAADGTSVPGASASVTTP